MSKPTVNDLIDFLVTSEYEPELVAASDPDAGAPNKVVVSDEMFEALSKRHDKTETLRGDKDSFKIYKTVYTFVAYHQQYDFPRDLSDAIHEADSGSMIGSEVKVGTFPVANESLNEALLFIGNDGSFFDDFEDDEDYEDDDSNG